MSGGRLHLTMRETPYVTNDSTSFSHQKLSQVNMLSSLHTKYLTYFLNNFYLSYYYFYYYFLNSNFFLTIFTNIYINYKNGKKWK